MRGSNSFARAVATLIVILTGVALATPVPVLAITDGSRQYVLYLPDGVQMSYTYRQSIYDVIVTEDFIRAGDDLDMQRVTATDIRAIEYFRWDSPITEIDGTYASSAPPTVVPELVIRITQNGQQGVRSGGWRVPLLERFGDAIVHVRPEREPLLVALLQGLVW